jgi:ubiquitin-like domain-containing CTD phosphatase 1
MEATNKIYVKWSGKEYEIELTENETVADLKNAIEKETGVRPERQKLLNLKLKGLGVIRV